MGRLLILLLIKVAVTDADKALRVKQWLIVFIDLYVPLKVADCVIELKAEAVDLSTVEMGCCIVERWFVVCISDRYVEVAESFD